MLLLERGVVPVVGLERVEVHAGERQIVLLVEVLRRGADVWGGGRGRGSGRGTHDFAEEDDVLAADEEEARAALCDRVSVVYPFDGVLEDEVGCASGGTRTARAREGTNGEWKGRCVIGARSTEKEKARWAHRTGRRSAGRRGAYGRRGG